MSTKPKTFNGDLRNLPTALTPLTKHKRWVVWLWELRRNKDGTEHWTKPPKQPSQPGHNAKSNNPDTWGMYEDAVKAVEAGNADGIGYMLKDADIGAADLDHCVDDGRINDWAGTLCQEAQGAYQEKTVSGTGLRIVGATVNRQPLHKRFSKGSNGEGLELYRNAERYITISGLQIAPCEQLPPIDDFLDMLVMRNEREQPNGNGKFDFNSAKQFDFNNAKQQRSWFDYDDMIKNGCGAGDNRSDLFHSVVGHLAAYGATAEEIIAKLARYPNGIGAKYADRLDKEVRRSYEKWRLRQPAGGTPLVILTKSDFIKDFVPPDYLIDYILQRRFIYSLTGQTGHGKTAIALLLAQLVGSTASEMLARHGVEHGNVFYFVGENPDDVRMRVIAADAMRTGDTNDSISFIPGVFDIGGMYSELNEQIRNHGAASLVIVDTSAAYFLKDDENSNPQMGEHARMLRRLTALPGGPCVLVLCHPIKNVIEPAQLLPRGGGAFLAEVDGNLTSWKRDDELVELHHTTKFRGPGFEPITFKIEKITTPQLVDSKGRPIPTVRAVPVGELEEARRATDTRDDEDRLLIALLHNSNRSMVDLARALGWTFADGRPAKSRVQRALDRLEKGKPKLITRGRGGWVLTEAGQKEAKECAMRSAAGPPKRAFHEG